MLSQVPRRAVLAAALLALPAFGQTLRSMEFKVPFPFQAGQQRWPAGKYEVTAGVGHSALRVRNLDTQSAATLLSNATQSGKTNSKSMLVFHKYGDTYYLNRLWLPDTFAGRELPLSRAERELTRTVELASTVTIAADGGGQ